MFSYMKKLLFVAMAMAFVSLSLSAQPVKETFLYAVKGTDSLYLDRWYDPEKITSEQSPVMIHMFGGGFAFGNRGGNYKYLTDIGVQVVSIDYRLGLTKYGYGPSPAEEREKAMDMALDDLTDAMAFVINHSTEWKADASKIMLQGSSAGGLTTLRAIYDVCNDGPYSKKFPEGWMPAGYIGYAGGLYIHDPELVWAKNPCPMMFFHGSSDTSVPYEIRRDGAFNVYGPAYIVRQLKKMGVPYWMYTEEGADHVLSYKAFTGYNTHEIQTFVQKFVVLGLPLQMNTVEANMVKPSHLPES